MKMEGNQWPDLPFDLVLTISNRLGLIDLLRFRGVCDYWRSSTSYDLAEIPQPWFLLHGETAECSILTNDNRIYRIAIPEMAKATCLASFVGWLLLYCKSSDSLFFFCPFSRAKIEIPPCSLISEPSESESKVLAAFSSYPTDSDCTVVVVKYENDSIIKLWMLRRGESKWTFQHEHICPIEFNEIRSVALQEKAFHFLDGSKMLVSFEYDTMTWVNYEIKPISKSCENGKRLDYWVDKNWVNKKSFSSKSDEMKQLLGIQDPCSISICGAMLLKNGANDRVISHEFLEKDFDDDDEWKPRRELNGVWFQPRFHQISQDQTW